MKRIAVVAVVMMLSGCAVVDKIPSFWDDNQSRAVIDLRLSIEKVDCTQPQATQVRELLDRVRWFQLYSESKGRQKDVLRVFEPMHKTVAEWNQRVESGADGSKAYCEIKKRVLTQQGRMAAEAVLGRY